jgi:hypothetical protein
MCSVSSLTALGPTPPLIVWMSFRLAIPWRSYTSGMTQVAERLIREYDALSRRLIAPSWNWTSASNRSDCPETR